MFACQIKISVMYLCTPGQIEMIKIDHSEKIAYLFGLLKHHGDNEAGCWFGLLKHHDDNEAGCWFGLLNEAGCWFGFSELRTLLHKD